MNEGELPRDYLEKIKEEELGENREEVDRLRAYEDELLSAIQDVTRQLDAIRPREGKYYRSQDRFYRNGEGRKEWEQEKVELNF